MTFRREVTRETLSALIRLNVHDTQAEFIAPNAKTLAQVAYEQPGSYVWGFWEGETPVGLMAMIHPRIYPWLEDGDDIDAAYIWRLMIAADQQGKGYGRRVIEEAQTITRDWHLPKLSLTVLDKPGSAVPFYEKLGFQRTGRIVDGEAEFMKTL